MRARQRFILYHQDLSVTASCSASTFLSAKQKSWVCFSLHLTKNTVFFFFFFWSRFLPLPAGLKGLMWFMTVVPDMYHHHPTLGSRMAGNFFSSSPSRRDSAEFCDTSTRFTFVSFIKREPVKPEHAGKLLSAERRGKHTRRWPRRHVPALMRRGLFELWPFLCPPPAPPWSVIWPVRCWVSTWQRSRRHRREWK